MNFFQFCDHIFRKTIANDLSGNTSHYSILGDIFYYHRTGPYDGTITNSHSAIDQYMRAYPNIIAHIDGIFRQCFVAYIFLCPNSLTTIPFLRKQG